MGKRQIRQCQYCFVEGPTFRERSLCLTCKQYYRRDRLWRLHAVFLCDNGTGAFSIAQRLGKSAYEEIIPLLIDANRLSRREWEPYVVSWKKVRGQETDDVEFYEVGKIS